MRYPDPRLGRSLPVMLTSILQSNRYPLHYAFALPPDTGTVVVNLLLQDKPDFFEKKTDKVGDHVTI